MYEWKDCLIISFQIAHFTLARRYSLGLLCCIVLRQFVASFQKLHLIFILDTTQWKQTKKPSRVANRSNRNKWTRVCSRMIQKEDKKRGVWQENVRLPPSFTIYNLYVYHKKLLFLSVELKNLASDSFHIVSPTLPGIASGYGWKHIRLKLD